MAGHIVQSGVLPAWQPACISCHWCADGWCAQSGGDLSQRKVTDSHARSEKERESPAMCPAGAQWAASADVMLTWQLLLLTQPPTFRPPLGKPACGQHHRQRQRVERGPEFNFTACHSQQRTMSVNHPAVTHAARSLGPPSQNTIVSSLVPAAAAKHSTQNGRAARAAPKRKWCP